MKKRILGLALALVMIISLLPLTAFAASPMPKFRMYDPAYDTYLESYFNASKTVYVVYENVYDTDGTTVIGNKPVIATETPADNYIKYSFADATATITLKNVNYKRTASADAFISILKNAGSNYTNEFNVVLLLEGTNTVEGANTHIYSEQVGTFTITGSGSLTINVGSGSSGVIWSKKAGDMLIKDTTLTIAQTNTNTGTCGNLIANGAITVENSNLTISASKASGMITGTAYGTKIDDTTKGISFTKGSVVSVITNSTMAVQTNGQITIDSSTVTLQKGTGNNTSAASSMPYITGSIASTELKKNSGASPAYKDASNYEIAAGTALTTTERIIGIKTVHTCAAQADDGDCSTAIACVCGKEAVAAKQHTGVVTDCTKDTLCTNAGCTKVYAAATATAHTPGADDGDCTTDIKCANCDQVATKGAEKHVWDRANCDVAGTCTTAGCTKTIEAGTHSGGTATCKDKAKCAECGKEYGELGACAPAADDGDCTTDIKCSVCGKTTTAGEAAHKYTDKNDTTCDNAGCTNTRKVEGTENPKTGDNSAFAVVAALMVTAAAAFVTTKKFAR